MLWHRISHSNVSSLSSQQGFSKALECWRLSDSLSTHPLTPTFQHPPLALKLRTRNYRPVGRATLTQFWKSTIWTLACLQETVYWHRSQHDSLCLPFISRAENQQQQSAANSPTKVIAVAQKDCSLQYISMSWHSEKYWRYYSMKGRQFPIPRRWGWNDTSFMAKCSVSLLKVTILQWGNVISCIYFRAVIKAAALQVNIAPLLHHSHSMISNLEEAHSLTLFFYFLKFQDS